MCGHGWPARGAALPCGGAGVVCVCVGVVVVVLVVLGAAAAPAMPAIAPPVASAPATSVALIASRLITRFRTSWFAGPDENQRAPRR
jgi:hypothetical protein